MAELKNEFSWSKSRAQCFEECPRQYYYRYYGSWGGWDSRADARTRTLYILKQLQSRQQWIGDVVHRCLHWVLATLRKSGAPPPEATALRHLVKRLDVDFQNSGEGLYWEKPKESCALLEHEYEDLDVSEEQWQEVFAKAAHCVHTFYESPVLAELAALPADRWLDLEELSSVSLDGVKVWVQLDFAHRDATGACIYDWKTGKADQQATREQLALYALYGAGRWKVQAADIRAVELNLATGERFEHRAEPADLETVRVRVAASAAAMKGLLEDAARNTAAEERFALTESDRPCRRCGFRRLCPRFAEAASPEASS